MKLSDVEIGGRYTAKVSQKVVVVKVVAIDEVPATRWSRAKTRIDAVNEATGRRVSLRSAQRLRSRLGCEFCEQKVNRPDEAFTCPYCHKAWPERRG